VDYRHRVVADGITLAKGKKELKKVVIPWLSLGEPAGVYTLIAGFHPFGKIPLWIYCHKRVILFHLFGWKLQVN
jgi:hypothetical protein